MRDIWNPWHGCIKKSEGCKNCYMYFLDAQRGQVGSNIFRVKNNFNYPLHKDRNGNYIIKSGEFLMVSMTSDFFLAEADQWRDDAWQIIRRRSDVVFILVTKRPERVEKCLPKNWNNGWPNVWLNVTIENQLRTDERAPILLNLPFVHKGFMVAPFIGEISLSKYLSRDIIENVWCGGEFYDGARPLYYSWVEKLAKECKSADVSFSFYETGNIFIKNGKRIIFKDKIESMKFAFQQHLNYESTRPQVFDISQGQMSLFETQTEKFYQPHCQYCSRKQFCAGCSRCGKCASRV